MTIIQISTDCSVFDRFCFDALLACFDESMDCIGGISHGEVRVQ